MLRLANPAGALPAVGQRMTVLRVSVTARSLDGEPVQLERAGLALPVLSQGDFDALADDELVDRRLVELSAAVALTQVREAAERQDWPRVAQLLARAEREFAGNDWVASMVAAMRSVAQTQDHARMRKEASYSTAMLRRRLTARDEVDEPWSPAAGDVPAFLRRKSLQGKVEY